MTVAEMIAQRTAALRTVLNNCAIAVDAKGGTPADDLSGLQDAIASIPTGVVLPELTTPAEVGHVLAGKEYIDGNGNKRAGTLVVCDTIEEVEYFGIAATGVSLDIESTADGSAMTMTLRETNLLPENIVAGSSIFGVPGTAKKLRVETGTITLAQDSLELELPCTENPKMFIVDAIEASRDEIIADNVNAMLSAVAVRYMVPYGKDGEYSDIPVAIITVHVTSAKINITARSCTFAPTVKIDQHYQYPWKAGVTYNWTAYYWEDDA